MKLQFISKYYQKARESQISDSVTGGELDAGNYELILSSSPEMCSPELHKYKKLWNYVSTEWYDDVRAVFDDGTMQDYERHKGQDQCRQHNCFGGFGDTHYYFNTEANVCYIQVPVLKTMTLKHIWLMLNTSLVKYCTLNETPQEVRDYGFVFRTDIHPTILLICMTEIRDVMNICGDGHYLSIGHHRVLHCDPDKIHNNFALEVQDGGIWENNECRDDIGLHLVECAEGHKFREDYELVDYIYGCTFYEVQGYFQGLSSSSRLLRWETFGTGSAEIQSMEAIEIVKGFPKYKNRFTKVNRG